MPYVRSQVAYNDFIAGRDVAQAMHREDGEAGYCIGSVAVARAGDEVIDQATYDTEAAAIATYNVENAPEPEQAPTPPQTIGEKLAPGLEAVADYIEVDDAINAAAALRVVAAELKAST